MWFTAIAACGGDDGGGSVVDAAPTMDAAPTSVDASTGLPSTCTGTCAATALTATFGGTTRTLDVAYYGLTRSGAETTVRIEAYRGADASCPTSSSSTPDQTLIFVALPVPTTVAPLTTVATLLDFEGALLTTTSARATTSTETPTAASVCPTCVGMPAPSDPDGLVALDATLAFPTGTISGHLNATHCDSLDAIE